MYPLNLTELHFIFFGRTLKLNFWYNRWKKMAFQWFRHKHIWLFFNHLSNQQHRLTPTLRRLLLQRTIRWPGTLKENGILLSIKNVLLMLSASSESQGITFTLDTQLFLGYEISNFDIWFRFDFSKHSYLEFLLSNLLICELGLRQNLADL